MPNTIYHQLRDVLQRQAEWLDRNDWEGYAQEELQRVSLFNALPDQPPADAQEIIAQLQALTHANTITLQQMKEQLGQNLAKARQERTVMDRYADQANEGIDHWA